jgi:hypothetical protein
MSMKTKKNRLAALALAALVVAGGTVAVPQAANAAVSYKTCGYDGYSCSTTVTAKQSTVSFRVMGSHMATSSQRFTMSTASGNVFCSGTITVNGAGKTCSLFGYKGKVKITVSKSWATGAQIKASF